MQKLTERGPAYELPFRTLHNKSIRNLLACGRSISVTDEMWDIARVIPTCAVTGEAAGTAAAMTDDFASIDIDALQASLLAMNTTAAAFPPGVDEFEAAGIEKAQSVLMKPWRVAASLRPIKTQSVLKQTPCVLL